MVLSLEDRALVEGGRQGSMLYTILATAISDRSKSMVVTVARDSNNVESNVMYLCMSNEIHVLLGV